MAISKADDRAVLRLEKLLQRVAGLELPVVARQTPRPAEPQSHGSLATTAIDGRYVAATFAFAAEFDVLNNLAAASGATLQEAFIATVGLFISRYAGDGVFQIGFHFRDNDVPFVDDKAPINRWLVDPGSNRSIREFIDSAREAIADRWSDVRADWNSLIGDVPLQVAASVPSDVSTGAVPAPALCSDVGESWRSDRTAPAIWFVLETGSGHDRARLRILASRQYRLLISLDRQFDQYRDLIARIGDAGNDALNATTVANAAEQNLLLGSWAGSADIAEPQESFLALFRRQVEERPQAPAVLWHDECVTYRGLRSRALRIAALLSAHGVQRHDVVAVCLERSPELIASLIAIFEVGAAYVPIDPAYPEERQRYIISHSQSKAVITARGCAEHLLPHLPSAIFIDNVNDAPMAPTLSDTGADVDPGDAAYIIYTSGSTGNPKGVVLEHRNLSAFLRWAAGLFDQSDVAGVLASTSICFDLSIFEMFLPLRQGGTVILCRNILELFELPTRDRITLINTVPSAMAALLRLEPLPPSVRTVNLAGEAFPGRLVEMLAASTTVKRVFNLYGPTEATVYSTVAQVDMRHPAAPPIGKPIAGTQAYVLDSARRLCPIGVAGELYLGGAGLARGYLHNPRATAERFVANPFGAPGTRLYRTGDRVRYNEDGELEFLGRTDHQVKVRGFRIELDEIASLLLREPGIREAVPIVVLGPDGDPRLAAYIVAEDTANPPRPESIRQALRSRVPSYMVPDAYKMIDAVPLTPNGKLDRKALPAIDWQIDGRVASAAAADDLRQATRPVADDLSHRLARIWAELLGIDATPIDATAHFLRLGGHSLSAVRAIARIRDAFGVDLSLSEFFQNLEFAAMSELLRNTQQRTRLRKQPVASSGAPVMSYPQQRFWFLDQLEPQSNSYNIAGIIWITGVLDVPRLEAALNGVVRRHHVLRTAFPSLDGAPRPTVLAPADSKIELKIVSPLGSRNGQAPSVETTAREEAAKLAERPFDLAKPPLLRFSLARMASDRHALLFATHHIIFDGWSFEIFTRDLARAYGAADPYAPVSGAGDERQYSDFAAWQRSPDQRLSQGRMIDFFRGVLRDAPAALPLPAATRRTIASAAGTAAVYPIGSALFDRVKTFAHAMNTTPFVPLLAAFGMSLNSRYGESDVVIGSAFAARSHSEFEDLIGCFANTLPLRLNVDTTLSFRELVRKTRDMAIAVHERQDLPLDRLVEALRPRRVQGRNPLFQVAFGIENAPATRHRCDTIALSWEEVELDQSRLDLTVWVAEKNGHASVRWRWNPQLLDADAASSLNRSWLRGLADALDDPDLPLRNIRGTRPRSSAITTSTSHA